MLLHYVKHLTGTPFLLHQSEETFVRLFFISVLQFEKLMETDSLYLRHLYRGFLNLLFWTIPMSPLTICPWFGSVNGDVVQGLSREKETKWYCILNEVKQILK